MNMAILVCLLASVNVMLVTSKAFPILEFEIDLNTDELPIYEDFEKRSLDNLKYGNILKRSFGPGSLDPLGNGNIPKWSKSLTIIDLIRSKSSRMKSTWLNPSNRP